MSGKSAHCPRRIRSHWYEHTTNGMENDDITFATMAEKFILAYEGREMSVQNFRMAQKAKLRHKAGETAAQFISRAEAILSDPYGQWNEISRVEAIEAISASHLRNFMKSHAWGPYASVTELSAAASRAESFIRQDPTLALQYQQSSAEVAADLAAEKAQPRARTPTDRPSMRSRSNRSRKATIPTAV